MFTAEFLRCATRGETTDDTLFAYVENSIRWLDGCEGSFANFHLVFMMRLALFLGFYPNLDGYTPGCRFDLRASCFRTDVPAHTERGRMADVILRYYQLHVPDFPALKSLPVLKELFG